MEKTVRAELKSIGARALIVLGDIVLIGFLAWELMALLTKYRSIQASLDGEILSNRPEEFIARLQSQLPDAFAWIVVIGGLVLTVFLTITIFVTKDRLNKIMTRINLVWLVVWLIFGIYLLATLIGLLVSFCALFGG